MKMLSRVPMLLWAVAASAQFVPNRYIVELDQEPAAGGAIRTRANLSIRRAQVQAGQRAVRASIQRQTSATVLDSVDTVANALVVEAAPDQVAGLAAVPGVARVYPEREFKPLLDQAVVVHHIDQAWNRVGQKNAGAGVKIAIIDTGIDVSHPGFDGATMPMPDGFPRANADANLAYTNSKVIVARSYASLFPHLDPDVTPRDHIGHGTALAMCAAGMPHAAPRAYISGVAPGAWLGNYKVFGSPGVNDNAPESAILKAMDDAVADGMDVINLSLGSDLAPRLEDDVEVKAIERATALGVMVVVAAGNAGPGAMTVGSPATAPSAIAVGASYNARVFTTTAVLGGTAYLSVTGSLRAETAEVTGPMVDVAGLDQDGLACSSLPAESLTGRVALILRGTCTFEQKLNNARDAGAVAAVVYTDAAHPDPVSMAMGSATLPAQMVSYQDGAEIKARLRAAGGTLPMTLRFTVQALPVDSHRLASFSSQGPGVDGSIKPDLLAVGMDVYTATQKLDTDGEMFDASGYIAVSGTSFSTPLVAGALAVLKAAHPGLSTAEYRSLLVNTSARLNPAAETDPQLAGAGVFDLDAALSSAAALSPAKLSFGVAGRNGGPTQTLTVRNLSPRDDSYSVSVEPRAGDTAAPHVSADALPVSASGTAQLGVQLDTLPAGSYEGFVVLRGAQSGTTVRVPYWFAVPTAAKQISVLVSATSARAGTNGNTAVLFRVMDASGVALTDQPPNVTISEGGTIRSVALREDMAAGAYAVDVRWAPLPGNNVITIQEGDAKAEVTVRAR